jgi:hypothetical protein
LGRKIAFPATTKIFDRLLASCQPSELALNQIFSKKPNIRAQKAEQLRHEVLQEAGELRARVEQFEDEGISPS